MIWLNRSNLQTRTVKTQHVVHNKALSTPHVDEKL